MATIKDLVCGYCNRNWIFNIIVMNLNLNLNSCMEVMAIKMDSAHSRIFTLLQNVLLDSAFLEPFVYYFLPTTALSLFLSV